MISTIGNILPFAGGLALSPIPLVAVILMLTGSSGQRNAFAFSLGWFTGILILCGLVILLVTGGSESTGQDSQTIAGIVKLAFGALLLFLAWKQWTSQPEPGQEAEPAAWLAALDSYSTVKCFGFGCLLGPVNVKNFPIVTSAAAVISASGLGLAQTSLTMVVFAFLGTVGLLVPIVLYLMGGETSKETLQSWRIWLERNNAIILCVLFLCLGLNALGKGMSILF